MQAEGGVVAKWPTYIPWLHGATTEKRFVCDVMLEGLARQMRLFGLDVLSMEQRDKTMRGHVLRCAPCVAVGYVELRIFIHTWPVEGVLTYAEVYTFHHKGVNSHSLL